MVLQREGSQKSSPSPETRQSPELASHQPAAVDKIGKENGGNDLSQEAQDARGQDGTTRKVESEREQNVPATSGAAVSGSHRGDLKDSTGSAVNDANVSNANDAQASKDTPLESILAVADSDLLKEMEIVPKSNETANAEERADKRVDVIAEDGGE